MKQLFQNLRSGKAELLDLPVPPVQPGYVLIGTRATLVSPGTERMLADFGRAGWLGKARQQPEKVRQVIDKIRTDGLEPTVRAVFTRLEEPMPVGYRSVGTVIQVGAGVSAFKAGDRVISNGAHAEIVCISENLCALVPQGVPDQAAAFTVLGAVALQGVRLLQPQLGENVAVLGLGLIGLLTVQILKASGCRVLGFDLDSKRVELARSFGIEAHESGSTDPVKAALAFSGGHGVDGVLITAATKSNAPILQAPRMCRKRGKVVLVGVAGLELSRADFYEKEISFQVSCSYGPGRYEENYEDKGLDYPIGFVRWTEQRNFTAVLDLLQSGKLQTEPLLSQRIPFSSAEQRYDALLADATVLGALFEYDAPVDTAQRTVRREPKTPSGAPAPKTAAQPVLGFIGAGSFVRATLLPAFKGAGSKIQALASASGRHGADLADKYDLAYHTNDYREILDDPAITGVVIATPHALHAQLVVEALAAGKHVFCEKPLVISAPQLAAVEAAVQQHPQQILMVGFNRRYAPHTLKIRELLTGRTQPLAMTMIVNAGAVSEDHWQSDPAQGGRIIGEGCHFVDLLCQIAGAPVRNVFSACGAAPGGIPDTASITLQFEDGSIGTVHYFTGGQREIPKERLEIFSEGRVLQLENFKLLKGFGFPAFDRLRLWHQDEGHAGQARAFVEALKTGRGFAVHEYFSVHRLLLEQPQASEA